MMIVKTAAEQSVYIYNSDTTGSEGIQSGYLIHFCRVSAA